MEWARSHGSRGFIASWPQFGVPCGLFLANLAVLAMSHIAGDEFMTWGWRVPFALSAILVVIGLWIRLGIMETPVFARLQRAEKLEQKPSVAVLSRHWREIILSAFARMGEQAPFYIFTAFVYSYAVGTLQIDRTLVLQAVLAAAVLEFVTIPYFGHLSDRIGRKRMYSLGAITVTFSGFIYFALLQTGSLTLVFIAIVLSLVPHAMLYGPQAALIAEQFPARLRYSGASLGYQLASVIAGGPAPLIATWLYAQYKSPYAIAAYIAVCGLLSLAAVAFMRDHTRQALSDT